MKYKNTQLMKLIQTQRKRFLVILLIIFFIGFGAVMFFPAKNAVTTSHVQTSEVIGAEKQNETVAATIKTSLHGYIELLSPTNETINRIEYDLFYNGSTIKYFHSHFTFKLTAENFQLNTSTGTIYMNEKIDIIHVLGTNTTKSLAQFNNTRVIPLTNVTTNQLQADYDFAFSIIDAISSKITLPQALIIISYQFSVDTHIKTAEGIPVNDTTIVGTPEDNPIELLYATDIDNETAPSPSNTKTQEGTITPESTPSLEEKTNGQYKALPISYPKSNLYVFSIFGGENDGILIFGVAVIFLGVILYLRTNDKTTKRTRRRR